MDTSGAGPSNDAAGTAQPATAAPTPTSSTAIPTFHFGGITSLTNLVARLPLPSALPEGGGGQTLINHPQTQHLASQHLSSDNVQLAKPIASALARSDTSAVVLKEPYARMASKVKLEVGGAGDPLLISTILTINPTVFHATLQQDHLASQASEQASDLCNNAAQPPPAAPPSQPPPSSAFPASQPQPMETSENSENNPMLPPVCTPTPGTSKERGGTELRKQIVSVGKQPKAHSKRRRDMVTDLFDSLTPDPNYFAPGSRRRSRAPRPFTEGEAALVKRDGSPDAEGRRRKRRLSDDGEGGDDEEYKQSERPLTPDEATGKDPPKDPKRQRFDVTEIREQNKNYQEAERVRRERRKRFEWHHGDYDEMVIQEVLSQFCSSIDQIFDNYEEMAMENNDDEDEIPSAQLIEKNVLNGLCEEAMKLKSMRKMHLVPIEKLTKLLTILEKNVRDSALGDGIASFLMDEKDEDDWDETYRQLIEERVLRSCIAAKAALTIMTAPSMPKEVIIEDTIERCIQLCKQLNNNVVFPTFDASCRTSSGGQAGSTGAAANADKSGSKSKNALKKGKAASQHRRTRTCKEVLRHMCDVIGCLAELVEERSLTETAIAQLCTLAVQPFFVEHVDDMQHQALQLAVVLFSKYDKYRNTILSDVLGGIHKLSVGKRVPRIYPCGLGNESVCIQMVTALVLQLIQSVVLRPLVARQQQQHGDDTVDHHDADEMHAAFNDAYDHASRFATQFLSKFLERCKKSEESYRLMFEEFLADLLKAVHRVQLPAAEMCLTILGHLLLQSFRNKQLDMSLRTTSLINLGTITADLRRVAVSSKDDSQTLDQVLSALGAADGEVASPRKPSQAHKLDEDVRNDLLQKALIENLFAIQCEEDPTLAYTVQFYLGQWHKDCFVRYQRERSDDANGSSGGAAGNGGRVAAGGNSKSRSVQDRQEKDEKALQMYNRAILYLNQLWADLCKTEQDVKSMQRPPPQSLEDSQVSFVVRYLASSRAFSQSFDLYLSSILQTVVSDTSQKLRTDAMKCLTKVLEADASVLMVPGVKNTVQARLVDSSSQVREATVNLIGKYISRRPELVHEYYDTLMNRILDTAISVRKCVIKILRDVCENRPGFDKIPEICARMVRRVNDDESIRKLIIETFHKLWFDPSKEAIQGKVIEHITDTVACCKSDGGLDALETLMSAILSKPKDKDGRERDVDKPTLQAATLIVNALIDKTLELDAKLDGQIKGRPASSAQSVDQRRLLACLSTLYLFSKTSPELLVAHAPTLRPYLAMSASGNNDQVLVLIQVVQILERVVPLMDHPDPAFLERLEESYARLTREGKVAVVTATVAAWSALILRQRRPLSRVVAMFKQYFKVMTAAYARIRHSGEIMPSERPLFLRSIFTVGLFFRYFDFDSPEAELPSPFTSSSDKETKPKEEEADEDGEGDEEDTEKKSPWAKYVFRILMEFCRYFKDEMLQSKSLMAMGNFCASHGSFLMHAELKELYKRILIFKPQTTLPQEYVRLKCQVLNNIETFLVADESRMVKSYEDWQKNKDTEHLAEMGDVSSGMGSTIIQLYWNSTLVSYFSGKKEVRQAAHKVITVTLQMGLVTPGTSIPTLIAMCTDPEMNIRNKAEAVLKDIWTKYGWQMVGSKAFGGVSESYILARDINQHDFATATNRPMVRGYFNNRPADVAAGGRTLAQDCSAKLQPLYHLVRDTKQVRRTITQQLLKMFDDGKNREFNELLYVADNLALFPYQLLDEVLFVIYHIDQIISVTGANWIQSFREHLLPRMGRQPSESQSEDDEPPKEIYVRLPQNVDPLFELIEQSKGCFLLLCLKEFLHRYYKEVDQAKISEYTPGEGKHDKAKVNRRSQYPSFDPMHLMNELQVPTDKAERRSIQNLWKLCLLFVKFRDMHLQYGEEDDEDDEGENVQGEQLGATTKTTVNPDLPPDVAAEAHND